MLYKYFGEDNTINEKVNNSIVVSIAIFFPSLCTPTVRLKPRWSGGLQGLYNNGFRMDAGG